MRLDFLGTYVLSNCICFVEFQLCVISLMFYLSFGNSNVCMQLICAKPDSGSQCFGLERKPKRRFDGKMRFNFLGKFILSKSFCFDQFSYGYYYTNVLVIFRKFKLVCAAASCKNRFGILMFCGWNNHQGICPHTPILRYKAFVLE